MLESFSAQAIQIIEEAKKIAVDLGSDVVGTEHLLLSMYQTPDSICRFLLQEKNITYEMLLETLKKITIIHKKSSNDLLFTDKFQEIVIKAEELADSVDSNYVFDEHLFYVLLKDDASAGTEILKSLNLNLEFLIHDIEDIFNFYKDSEFSNEEPYPYLINLTKKAMIHPFIKRNNYIERINYILNKKQKNNPLLIGNAGVGKTTIVEGLSQLRNNEIIYQLDLGGVVAGTKYRGELEEKLLKVMEYIKSQKAILFIDEIHNVVGAGSNEGSLDIANILKPYLSRTDISVIGATTLEEYYKFIDKDKALMRRFQTVFIDEPTEDETKTILLGIKDKYEEFHHTTFSNDDIDLIIDKCSLYLPQRAFPDKAIDVLDEVGSRYQENSKLVSPKETIINEVIQDITNIHIISYEELKQMKLNYQILKPYYFRFMERVKVYPNIFIAYVDKDFDINVLLQDLSKVFNFKKEMLLEIDLDNYQDSTMINNLLGSSKGYVGYEQGGLISEHIIKYPFGVVYFKNYHMVHHTIKSVLEKIMHTPFFYDNKGRRINLQNTIFVVDEHDNTHTIGFNKKEKTTAGNKLILPTIHLQKDNSCYNRIMEKYHLNKNLIISDNPNEIEKTIYESLF